MDEYSNSYYALFRAVTKAIAEIDLCNYGVAKALLIQGQQTAEELFIRAEEVADKD